MRGCLLNEVLKDKSLPGKPRVFLCETTIWSQERSLILQDTIKSTALSMPSPALNWVTEPDLVDLIGC